MQLHPPAYTICRGQLKKKRRNLLKKKSKNNDQTEKTEIKTHTKKNKHVKHRRNQEKPTHTPAASQRMKPNNKKTNTPRLTKKQADHVKWKKNNQIAKE